MRYIRRIFSLVTVALVMTAMMLASTAVPAFAESPWSESQGSCETKQEGKEGTQYTREGTNQEKVKCFVTPEGYLEHAQQR